ncbi:MAG: GH3 auxin-responsive promoter family protein, partial [Bacteroidota bacterium]|nr:GH3 auxin-responsive promoter family protein [Bacteroidota bacterium]
MGIRSFLVKPIANFLISQNQKWIKDPIAFQEKIFKKLIAKGRQTSFGKDHQFSKINNYEDFKKNVPIADYEDLKN